MNIFNEVHEQAKGLAKTKGKRASWKGTLSINLPELEIHEQRYLLKGAKVDSTHKAIEIAHVDRETGKPVVSKEVVIQGDELIQGAVVQRKYLDEEEYNAGNRIIVPEDKVAHIQDGQEVSMFERTQEILIGGDTATEDLNRLSEYKFDNLYMLKANIDKGFGENVNRVRELAKKLLEKQKILVGTFTWGRGFNYYECVIFPYKREQDDRLWLVAGMAEGCYDFDTAWALQSYTGAVAAKVKLSAPMIPRKAK